MGKSTGISVKGGNVEKRAVDAVADAIVTVFAAGDNFRMEQKTIRTALGIVERMGVVQGVSISGCHIDSGHPAYPHNIKLGGI